MPRDEQHRSKSQRNESFAESLDHSIPIQESWAVVAAFYAALHYVQIYFSRFGIVIEGHGQRFDEIKNEPRLKNALPQYKFLFALSKRARYECIALDPEAYKKHAKPHLDFVKRQVDHALQDAENRRIGRQ